MLPLHLLTSRRVLLRALAVGTVAFLPGGAGRRRSAPAGLSRADGDRSPNAQWFGVENVSARLAEDEIPLLIPEDIAEGEAWVDINLTKQAAVAMSGRDWTRVVPVTTGKIGWDTPEGEFRIVRRVPNETMTSASLSIDDPNDQYVLTGVLYTQYFTSVGHALHLNYWQPESVFGNRRTSHGCVGMRLADAEYLWRQLGIGSRVVIHV